MSQTVITEAFEQWKAQQAADNQPVILDEFVLANVPGLDPSKPIDRKESIPAAAQIVYRQAVSKTGVVNDNSVVYSVTIGADVGDFDFNWIGLVNKATGTLAMIVHAPVQSKVKNANGQQGNVLTRSFLMEYSGAVSQTLISTPAASWQIDFTARLAGMDEALRLANLDSYGTGAFFDAGFLVAKAGSQHFVTQGVGYIGGLRAVLAENTNVAVAPVSTKIWADVSYSGTLTSAYQTAIKFTVAPTLTNYTTNGVAHYVFALASIDASGAITDLRPKGSSLYLRKDNNLKEIADPAAALNALNGVPKTRKVNNKDLSADITLTPDDVGALPSGATAVAATKLATPRKIAGVEFDGTKDINLTPENVGALPSGGTAAAATKLATARKIAGVAFDGSKDIAITSGDVGAVQQGGGVGMTTNKVILGWDGKKLKAQIDSTSMGALYCEKNKPTAQDTGALPIEGGHLTGSVTTSGDISAVGDIHSDRNIHSSGIIQAAKGVYDSPNVRVYSPNNKPNAGDVGAVRQGGGEGMFNNVIYFGWDGSKLIGQVDSTGMGAIYCGYNKPTPADVNCIQRDVCDAAGFEAGNVNVPYMRHVWSNQSIYLATQSWVIQNFVQSMRLAGRTVIADTGGRIDLPSGCVYTGMSGANYAPGSWGAYSAVQILAGGKWVTIGTA